MVLAARPLSRVGCAPAKHQLRSSQTSGGDGATKAEEVLSLTFGK